MTPGRAGVRATEDLDFFIRATAENVERLKRAFQQVYSDDPNIDDISADDLLGEYPAGLSLLAPQRGRFMSRLKAAEPLLGLLGRPNQIQLL